MINQSIIRAVPRGFPAKHRKNESETALFAAHGCVLMEQAGNGKYSYRAVNVKSGRSVYLGHRVEKLPEPLYAKVAEQMAKCAASDGWLLADAGRDTAHGKARLEDILKAAFEDILPRHGFTARAKQIELAGEILGALCGIGVQLAEAEVGTGKTLAYLLPAALIRRGRANSGKINTMSPQTGYQQPVVIATSSIALQRAIEQDYIPALSEILMKHGIINAPLTSALRKGKGNYICERRLANFNTHANFQTKAITAPLLTSRTVDLASVKGLTPYIKRNICVDNHCGNDCPKFGNCRYMRHLADVRRGGYDFQVCNHNYLLADVIHRSKGVKPLLPDYQAVIIDEAHKFLDAARGMYGSAIMLAELHGAVKDIRGFTFGHRQPTADVNRELDRLQSKTGLLFNYLNQEVPEAGSDEDTERHPTKIRQRSGGLIRAIRENIGTLNALLETRTVAERFENQFRTVKRSLKRIGESLAAFCEHDKLVYWLEEGEYASLIPGNADYLLNTLRGIPKNLGGLLHRDLWGMKIPIILTSGTLSAAGSFEHIKTKTGIGLLPDGRISETSKPSPFNHKENALLYISEATPFPSNKDEEYIAALAGETERLIRASRGHAAVLFTSYRAMDMVWAKIRARGLPYPMFRLDRGGAAVIKQFTKSGDGVLFACGAMWEGIDIPGDILSMLIIPRLPFAVPDPVSDWEKTQYSGMDEYIRAAVVPEMLVKLKQGFGRLIRTVTDTGVVAILDSRANGRGAYRSRVLAALPECGVTNSVSVVSRFIEDKKTPEYFEGGAL